MFPGKRLTKIIIVLAIPLTACTASKFGPVPNQESARGHAVHVGIDGTYYEIPGQAKDPYSGVLKDQPISSEAGYVRVRGCGPKPEKFLPTHCQLEDQLAIEKRDFEEVVEGIMSMPEENEAGPRKVMIYLHGGLNARTQRLNNVVKAIEKIGEDKKNAIYPIFINWQSGMLTTFEDHYWRIRDGEIDNSAKATGPLYFAFDFFSSIGNAPLAWWKEGKQGIQTAYFTDYEVLYTKPNGFSSDNIVIDPNQKDSSASRTALWWITSPFKVVTTPFVYTYGNQAWDQMERRVDTQFVNQTDLANGTRQELESDLNSDLGAMARTEGATLKLIKYIERRLEEENVDFELTLIGHSMGAIIVNRMLDNKPSIRTRNIVYMASADTLYNFVYTTLPYVRSQLQMQAAPSTSLNQATPGIDVYNLFLNPENEDREVSGYGFAPSGSLLVWIDTMYARPEYVLKRTAGRWSNMHQILNLVPEDIRDRVHFRVFGKATGCPSPQKHGEFDDAGCDFWQENFWKGDVNVGS